MSIAPGQLGPEIEMLAAQLRLLREQNAGNQAFDHIVASGLEQAAELRAALPVEVVPEWGRALLHASATWTALFGKLRVVRPFADPTASALVVLHTGNWCGLDLLDGPRS